MFWGDDDVQAFWIGALDGAVKLTATNWLRATTTDAWFVGLSARIDPLDSLAVALEASARVNVDDRPPLGGVFRVDWHDARVLGRWLGAHVGYQQRWYERGFGPSDRLDDPTVAPLLPLVEDTYVTNPFEYMALAGFYHQWSHTVMAEVTSEPVPGLRLFGDVEWWWRAFYDPDDDAPVVVLRDRGRAPGAEARTFYRAGIAATLWPELPHHGRVFIANKQAGWWFLVEDAGRFFHQTLVGLELRVFL